MAGRLAGKVAIVTGAGSGIGAACAKRFVEEGAKVFGTDINFDAVKDMADALGPDAFPWKHDVASEDEWRGVIAETKARFGGLHILVNNAGITKDQLLMRMTEEDWDSVMDINLKSCYNLCHALIRQMMKERWGRIINISSVVGLIGNPGQTNYAASKAGMIGFTKALARELAPRGVLVNAVAPGYIETKMLGALGEEKLNEVAKLIPLGRLGQAEEVADLVLFLSSTQSGYITGQVFSVDGGLSM